MTGLRMMNTRLCLCQTRCEFAVPCSSVSLSGSIGFCAEQKREGSLASFASCLVQLDNWAWIMVVAFMLAQVCVWVGSWSAMLFEFVSDSVPARMFNLNLSLICKSGWRTEKCCTHQLICSFVHRMWFKWNFDRLLRTTSTTSRVEGTVLLTGGTFNFKMLFEDYGQNLILYVWLSFSLSESDSAFQNQRGHVTMSGLPTGYHT